MIYQVTRIDPVEETFEISDVDNIEAILRLAAIVGKFVHILAIDGQGCVVAESEHYGSMTADESVANFYRAFESVF